MPILNFGEKLPSVYLEKFNPPENVATRVSILALQAIGVEAHWLDYEHAGYKGLYKCCGGICCKAFGTRSQMYHVPVYVYTNPTQNAQGQLMDWSMTKTVYNMICDYAQRYNLLEWDLDVVKTRQGQGTRTNMTIVPDVKMRAYWTPEQKATVDESVRVFYQIGETTLAQDCDENKYMQILTELGYDFQTNTFPQIAASGFKGSNVAISAMSRAPQFGAQATAQIPQFNQAAPGLPTMAPAMSQPVINAASAPVQSAAVPNVMQNAPTQPGVVSTPTFASAPTQPTMAQPVAAQPVQMPTIGASAFPSSAPSPVVTEKAREITADEIDDLLD